ncbi:dipeptide/oligopeptide/nickel ABC transporter permease/ATP-binding protein [Alkalihalobacillus sp. AL-G]|uniref:dipeptide/oligopeptide/nickel ABC transporter permease/ATP-binding protein n=1 Tax=Alkalihalobacillus sp. AL-G TaxID=2926399 RepID=UPI00272B51B9|nr:dipeptide/oligopeptide/nickel ABC transporter permease/ATP-binding protein [Alkalihalobacillus sp. AL-G]WLD94574.1 dipeptide/oligopeptide/nickel ABC transporter permease/ATP-binding protein [Alkalihalobacillus sp. AL-G]
MLRYLGLGILLIFVVIALIAPLISPGDPHAYKGPMLSAPNDEYLLGTNDVGQDILSQLIYGSRTSLFIGITVGLISTSLSVGLGLLSGFNRKLDPYIMGLCNTILAIPNLLIVIIIVAFTGTNLWNVIVVLSLLTWPGYARIIRSEVMSLRERDYVKAVSTFGAKQNYILYKHILPGISSLAVVKFINTAQSAIVAEASLSFLGLGDVTKISWGMMLHYAFESDSTFISSAWQWWVLPPTACITLLIVSFAFLGYGKDSKKISRRTLNNKKVTKEDSKSELLSNETLLNIKDLEIKYLINTNQKKHKFGHKTAVNKASLTVHKGEIMALVGESGSGKTTIAKSLLRMLPSAQVSGTIQFKKNSVLDMTANEYKKLRWVDISMIFQDAKQSLNPVMKIGDQVDEVLVYRLGMKREHARSRTKGLLNDVGLDQSVINKYPHELSGGMCTRAVISMALACEPELLIADEPTSSLDTITRKKVLQLLKSKVDQFNLSMLFITHDMGVVAEMADTVAVIKNGEIVEDGSVWDVFDSPEHPYTKELIGSRNTSEFYKVSVKG